jgi:hypothetical protein
MRKMKQDFVAPRHSNLNSTVKKEGLKIYYIGGIRTNTDRGVCYYTPSTTMVYIDTSS